MTWKDNLQFIWLITSKQALNFHSEVNMGESYFLGKIREMEVDFSSFEVQLDSF